MNKYCGLIILEIHYSWVVAIHPIKFYKNFKAPFTLDVIH
jgi:hypothetical protein